MSWAELGLNVSCLGFVGLKKTLPRPTLAKSTVLRLYTYGFLLHWADVPACYIFIARQDSNADARRDIDIVFLSVCPPPVCPSATFRYCV